jgi:hypothetical protein
VAAIKAGFHAVKRGERKKARQAWSIIIHCMRTN